MRLKVVDTVWKIRLVTREAFNEMFEDGEALTDTDNFEVYFIKGVVTQNVVQHELVHVYFSLALVNSATLSKDDTEEVFAELFGKYAEQYIKDCRKVLKYLLKLDKK